MTCRLVTLTWVYLKENCLVGMKMRIREGIAGVPVRILHRLRGNMRQKVEEVTLKT